MAAQLILILVNEVNSEQAKAAMRSTAESDAVTLHTDAQGRRVTARDDFTSKLGSVPGRLLAYKNHATAVFFAKQCSIERGCLCITTLTGSQVTPALWLWW